MTNSKEKRSWLLLGKITKEDDFSGTTLVNLDLVRRVVITSMTEIKLFYSDTAVETIQGTGALELLKALLHRSMTISGVPIIVPPTSDEPASV